MVTTEEWESLAIFTRGRSEMVGVRREEAYGGFYRC